MVFLALCASVTLVAQSQVVEECLAEGDVIVSYLFGASHTLRHKPVQHRRGYEAITSHIDIEQLTSRLDGVEKAWRTFPVVHAKADLNKAYLHKNGLEKAMAHPLRRIIELKQISA